MVDSATVPGMQIQAVSKQISIRLQVQLRALDENSFCEATMCLDCLLSLSCMASSSVDYRQRPHGT